MDALWPIQSIQLLDISQQGIFKYILIQVFIGEQMLGYLVRGHTKHEYHREILKAFLEQLKGKGFKDVEKKGNVVKGKHKKNGQVYSFKCPGGGRIQHNYKGKICQIYGYSKSYGRVDHKIAQKMVSQKFGYLPEEIILNAKEY